MSALFNQIADQVIVDRDYYPIPSDLPEVEARALQLYQQVIHCRDAGNFRTAIICEAKLGGLASQSSGTTTHEQIGVLQRRLNADMDRRLTASKIENTGIDKSLSLLEKIV